MQAQGKYWCFTLNNPTLTADQVHVALAPSYLVLQKEKVTTPHYQGYVEYDKLKRGAQLAKLLPGAHWERRRGTQSEAVEYCKKADSRIEGPWEFGTPAENRQGHRSDIDRVAELVQQGGILAVVNEDPGAIIRYPRGIQTLASLIRPPKPVPHVQLLFGPTGVGKTRRVHDGLAMDLIWSLPAGSNGVWFDGYDRHKYGLLDDFAGGLSHFPLGQLLRILDRYDLRVPTKGGHTWWVPEYIYITTNIHPKHWYDFSERSMQWRALVRRFTSVVWWRDRDADSEPVELGPDAPHPDGWDWESFWVGPPGQLTDYSTTPDAYFTF